MSENYYEIGDELFQQSVVEFTKQEEEKEKKGNFTPPEYEEIAYSALETGGLKFIRVLGLPINLREKDPQCSPKIVYISNIVQDYKNNSKPKRFRCIWPNRHENRNWPLYRIMDKVLDYDYDSSTNNRIYKYRDKYPTLFNRVFKNDNNEQAYERGWKPAQYVIMNVIDRAMYDWHVENKHSALLSKKATTYTRDDGTEITFYEPGVPYSLYKLLMGDEIAGIYHHFINYDVVIKKLDKDPYYMMYHPEEEKKFIGTTYKTVEGLKEAYPFYDPKVHIRPLTEEEKSWERYDIEKLFKVTSYRKILNRLGDLVKEYDATFHDNIYDEIHEKAEEEKKLYAELNDDDEPVEPKKQVVKEEPKKIDETPAPKTRTREASKTEKPTINFQEFIDKGFKGIEKLTDEQKAKIVGYDEDKGTFLYDGTEEVYTCLNAKNESDPCSCLAPESFDSCPICGVEF